MKIKVITGQARGIKIVPINLVVAANVSHHGPSPWHGSNDLLACSCWGKVINETVEPPHDLNSIEVIP
jgi:hypothetical protein